jgi:hypothetical protein
MLYAEICPKVRRHNGLRSKKKIRGRRGRDHMVVGFTTTYAIKPITTDVVGSNLAQGQSLYYQYMLDKFHFF